MDYVAMIEGSDVSTGEYRAINARTLARKERNRRKELLGASADELRSLGVYRSGRLGNLVKLRPRDLKQ